MREAVDTGELILLSSATMRSLTACGSIGQCNPQTGQLHHCAPAACLFTLPREITLRPVSYVGHNVLTSVQKKKKN